MERNRTPHRGARFVAAMVAGLMIGGVCTTFSASAADTTTAAGYSAAQSDVTLPATVPSLDGWKAATGEWTLGEGTRVVASAALKSRADSLATELSKFTGVDVKAATGEATGKDVSLTLDASKKDALGDEGFTLDIGADGLKVIGATDTGVFYGTRSVSQLLRQGQLTLPAGSVTSKPAYKERGATLCACQINISTDWIDRFLSDMADLRLNYVLMEMKLKPGEENTKKAATWSYYTRDDVKKFVAKAKSYGIDVIPEINSPGHMNIWLENYPEYQLADKNGTKYPNMLDITNPAAVKFYETLIDEYDGVFDTDYWHMGADEYWLGTPGQSYFPAVSEYAAEKYGEGATLNDAFTGFINTINEYVRAKGKKLRIWNDGIVDTKNVTLNKDITVEYWYGASGSRTPQGLADSGYTLMNATDSLYWSRSATGYKVNARALYNNRNWNVGTFTGGRQIDKNYKGLTGAKVSIWPDTSYFQTENEVEQEIFDGLRFVSQMTWSDSRPWANWDAMKAAIDKIGYPLDVREYDYTPVDAGTYTIPELDSVSTGTWTLKTTPDGYYQFKDDASGKCLALYQGVGSSKLVTKHLDVVTQDGARPELRTCTDVSVDWSHRSDANNRNTQKWQIRAGKDGKYTISPALTQQRLAIATGNESSVDLDLLKADTPDAYPVKGTLAQFPPDMVGDNALFTLERKLGMTATEKSTDVTPATPTDITVSVNAATGENTGDVTVTPTVPEGWKVLPGKVNLKSIPAGKTAKAIFRVVNTAEAAEGDADVTFKLTKTSDGSELGSTTVSLNGTLTAEVPTSDPAADSAESTAEQTPVTNAFDKNPNTFWHSDYSNGAQPPHWVAFKADPGEGQKITAVTHLYRQDKADSSLNGPAKTVEVYVVSADGIDSVSKVTDWGDPVVTANFPYTKALQTIKLPDSVPAGAVYVKFLIKDSWGITETGAGVSWAAIAELTAQAPVAAVELTEPEQPKDNPSVTEPEPTQVDKTALKKAVADAEGKLKTPNKYTDAEAVKKAQAALEAAKKVAADDTATQDDVDAAAKTLNDAIGKLVEDTIKPTLAGVDDVTITVGDTFDPLSGVSATDNVKQDLSIVVEGKVDTTKAGVYTLTYTVTDKAGNTTTAKRKVTVKEKGEEPTPSPEPEKPGTGKPGSENPTPEPGKKPAAKPSDKTDGKGKLSATGADTAALTMIAALLAGTGAGVAVARRRRSQC
ncbi:family 20 glycosylhydrolase [Bifidobacterium leontopitheci]|uniref:Lacto-N-biosidase n=1 Tax=Bifidobacterium leontopitheci TaxID=2650774 RepID=A0A6I1GSZ2_9BIFI|nr:family 20 glycosylhydrolase [Bifidobacterium leontopitheci]KAB7789581.1 lacto-N-biosidase [Bifidobacterium leontopitheci]